MRFTCAPQVLQRQRPVLELRSFPEVLGAPTHLGFTVQGRNHRCHNNHKKLVDFEALHISSKFRTNDKNKSRPA